MKCIIILERHGITEYWSQYGGFVTDRDDAREYSRGAADMQLRNLHGIARYGAEHKDWIGAKVEEVVTESITT
jgi:hypothetical protein